MHSLATPSTKSSRAPACTELLPWLEALDRSSSLPREIRHTDAALRAVTHACLQGSPAPASCHPCSTCIESGHVTTARLFKARNSLITQDSRLETLTFVDSSSRLGLTNRLPILKHAPCPCHEPSMQPVPPQESPRPTSPLSLRRDFWLGSKPLL
ncbi:hypothetical protein IE81DRAFT_185422 [Ceraceosorus guamensis]|uniref:Uncharacterized protein n=1 Tax=Ceraceosorus guamensis TaxID=1522189 RepID=A0A316VU71_9BASI|nr:hypothetical protein IE81DRAFT_185422 [Ceraceosorus guamensis]PWN41127.1 hypothetical protein IE81DRAFT_185422 [Ceraceosorus guamensis]